MSDISNDLESVKNVSPVFMFSGQGSQKQGMGADLADDASAQEVFECASDILGRSIVDIMLDGPTELLNDTRYAQPAVASMSIALTRLMMNRGIRPRACLGFSLGQVSALYATGMLSLEDTFSFIKMRSEAMAEAADEHPGAMCALLGADPESAQQLCDEQAHDQVLVVANYNSPVQIVISGEVDAIERAEKAWGDQKKRSARLATSGAFHSPLMQSAADRVASYLSQVTFAQAQYPLICNVDAQPLEAATAAHHLSDHLTHPVLFQHSVESLVEDDAHDYIEIGVGGVLVGLVKRIDKGSTRTAIDSKASLNTYFSS